MKRERLTPRNEKKKANKSVSPHKALSKAKLKNYFPAPRDADKECEQPNSKDEHSMKICLDLANYHKKESEMLKKKNELLEAKFTEQVDDLERLRS